MKYFLAVEEVPPVFKRIGFSAPPADTMAILQEIPEGDAMDSPSIISVANRLAHSLPEGTDSAIVNFQPNRELEYTLADALHARGIDARIGVALTPYGDKPARAETYPAALGKGLGNLFRVTSLLSKLL